jgi:D-threo-aldose 1-dehydrogenase
MSSTWPTEGATSFRRFRQLWGVSGDDIGGTGLRVTRLGVGGVALSGAPPATDPHQTTSEPDAIALIQRALALGLNNFDTAPMYGVGQSERRYGQALHGLERDRYVLSTKVGRVLRPSEPGGL